MGKTGADAAGKALSSRYALDRRTHDRHLARGEVEHAFDRRCVPCRAFALHPATQPLQHRFGIKGKIGWIHVVSLFVVLIAPASRARTKNSGDDFVKSNALKPLFIHSYTFDPAPNRLTRIALGA